ncbi:Uncharacterised protein [Acinetobacter phage MD-2021a]|nr:Uncharacterised protein [Acinetobacter phage MD-2021a]CAH1088619.1 Uncharacterised protein [Acinetobacter phage MD-2021a]
MDKYFLTNNIKTTPTSFFYEYQEMRKAHRMVDEKLEFLASVLVRKYGIPEAVRKYERYTQKRTDEYFKYDEVGFVESETDAKVATVTLKREYFDWKDYKPSEMHYWIEVWVCDELKEFIGEGNE